MELEMPMEVPMELDMDFLKTLISDFDLMAMLPDLADLMDWIVKGVNIALIIGPVVLAVMGLWYLLLPTREANHVVGYRFFWGMGSVKSWKFTQRLAGLVWLIMGVRMAREAYERSAQLEALETIELMYTAIETIISQVGTVIISCVIINAVIFLLFNFKGNYRRLWRFLGRKIKELFDKLVAMISGAIKNAMNKNKAEK